ncbi:hypothetical protein GCM10027610_046620 [Dactylosporangium cerinum]
MYARISFEARTLREAPHGDSTAVAGDARRCAEQDDEHAGGRAGRAAPKGGLPGSQQVLSQLTPGDRAAISGLTGYHLSPTGAVTNVGGMPPWSFIMAFAASRTAAQPEVDAEKATDVTAVEHVDVTV